MGECVQSATLGNHTWPCQARSADDRQQQAKGHPRTLLARRWLSPLAWDNTQIRLARRYAKMGRDMAIPQIVQAASIASIDGTSYSIGSSVVPPAHASRLATPKDSREYSREPGCSLIPSGIAYFRFCNFWIRAARSSALRFVTACSSVIPECRVPGAKSLALTLAVAGIPFLRQEPCNLTTRACWAIALMTSGEQPSHSMLRAVCFAGESASGLVLTCRFVFMVLCSLCSCPGICPYPYTCSDHASPPVPGKSLIPLTFVSIPHGPM